MDLRAIGQRLRLADIPAAFSIMALVLIGLSAIYSVALSESADEFLNVKKQIAALLLGIIAFFFIANANYRLLRSYALVSYMVGVSLLFLVKVAGSTIRGTTGWFVIGPISFQPAELMKLILVICLASYFTSRARRSFRLRELFESLAIAALPALLVLWEPDLGSAVMLLGIWFGVVLFAGLPKRYLAGLILALVAVSLLSWHFVLAPYQKDRILVFVNPSLDALGRGYNVNQAVIAVGSGGWFGRGLGFGSQSQLNFLPESQTDFIFAVIGEELGLVGVTLVLGFWLFLLFRILRQAERTSDPFATLLLIGIASSFLLQTCIHIGMNLGALPVTGLGLPLVSYGGSSLFFTLLMFGVVENVARSSARMS